MFFLKTLMNEICKKLSMDFEWKDFEIKFQIKKLIILLEIGLKNLEKISTISYLVLGCFIQ